MWRGNYGVVPMITVASGILWRSDTPSVANSVSWPNDWGPRACGWVKLQDRLTTTSARIDYRTGNGLFPSDHYPVVAGIRYA